MKFCDKEIQEYLLKGGKIIRNGLAVPIFIRKNDIAKLLYSKYPQGLEVYTITGVDLEDNTWEIVEPEYDWDKIVKDKVLCVFWNNNSDNYAIGHIIKVLDNNCHKFVSETYGKNQVRGIHWLHCKPFNPADFNC